MRNETPAFLSTVVILTSSTFKWRVLGIPKFVKGMTNVE